MDSVLFLANLFLLALVSGERNVLLISPLSVCGDSKVSIPMCSSLTAFGHSIHQTASDNCSIVTDIHSYPTVNDGGLLQLALLSRKIVSMLSEHMFLSSSGIARALGALTQHFNWNRLLIVADLSNPYFLHTAEEFYKVIRPTSSEVTYVQLQNDGDIHDLVNRIEKENLKIIVLSVRPSIASKLLCIVQEKEWFWPNYAWIVHSIDLDKATCTCNSDEIGILSIKDHGFSSYNTSFIHSMTYSTENTIFYSLADIQVLPPMVEIAIHGGVRIATYSFENGTLSSIDITGSIPSDLPPEYIAVGFIVLYYFCIAFCFLTVTVNFILYIYFRNEPTVKASSVPLSILIFIGCYLLLIYINDLMFLILPSHYKHSKPFRDGVCVVAALLSFLSYPIILIFSTLLVKLLRVYRIFNKFGKMNKCACGDLALAGYALLISSPSAILLLVWMFSDPYTDLIRYLYI